MKNEEFTLSWKILAKARAYSNLSKRCNLCIEAKYFIITNPQMTTLNRRNELVSTCRHQSRPQSSSLSRMTEGEKSSGEPWNRRLSHSRNKEHAHDWLIQMKSLLNALLCESAAYYNMRGRKSFLLLEILAVNSNGIKRKEIL